MILFKNFFDFRKPKFQELEYIDLVVEDKILLLISWKTRRHHKVKIHPFHKINYNHQTAVILRFSTDTTKIIITLKSLWRRRKYSVLLKKIKLDKETAQHLITQFEPVKMLMLKTPMVKKITTFYHATTPIISVKKCGFNINVPTISINTVKLIYTVKNNYYE